MTLHGKPRSALRVGTPLLVAFLGASLVLSSWLAWEAVEAARSHREVAEEVLTDYAAVAASESARLSRDVLDDFLDELFDDVPRFTRRETLPGPEAVAGEVDRALRGVACDCAALRAPLVVFRHDLTDDAVQVHGRDADGRPVPPEVAELVEAAHAHRAASGEEAGFQGLVLVDPASGGSSVALLHHLTRGPEMVPRALYGYAAPAEALAGLLEAGLSRSSLLPRSVLGDVPRDSLLDVRVLGPGGIEVTRSPGYRASPFVTRSSVAPELGGLTLEVSVRPEAADHLIIGGLPRSRLPLLLVLLVLTAGVGAAGLVELRRSHELARLREDFVSSVSHELRTPLTQIRMLAELLEEEKLRTPGERARSTRIIRREAQRLTMLVENVLQFARSRAAPSTPGETPAVEVGEVVADAVASLEAVTARDEARVEVRGEPGLRARIQREALRRVVGNLLDNAVKYGPSGQTVVVALDAEAGWVRIVVEDEGPGIPPEAREAVWEPYRRLGREVDGRRPGSGLGLAVVRELVARFGGSVEICDGPTGGARFVVRLPEPQEEVAA